MKGEALDQDHTEPLEEILKRIQFNKINLEGSFLNDEVLPPIQVFHFIPFINRLYFFCFFFFLQSSVILFDMLEYYESARYLNISFNPEIGIRGWQACSHMIKKVFRLLNIRYISNGILKDVCLVQYSLS